ncbi:hypothetical protein HYH03_013496 [Edaphochlamys debaryana]|uniref:SPX domain-containing protein n=1 Tax=Edaphochlamys debaryana TaxID=47281 RepID=A0A836BSW5_9CHLO|nr:hypothetical protein HYH03_013496 [Edaphochlamys debaryana]|eukprot:KAG2487916.1 hypothetical protein HYH03_013496 [Edaphochlamys debaryana]
MKFNKYLRANQEESWKEHYIHYSELKKLLYSILEEGAPVYVPTALSLTTGRGPDSKPTPQERFFMFLEADVKRINDFTTEVAAQLRAQLRAVVLGLAGGSPASASPPPPQPPADLADAGVRGRWLAAARRLGEEYLRLEKYVNINYTGLQKILKKHDKLIPTAPCWHFYKVFINRQPWVRGEHHDIQVTLSRIFSQLHSAAVAFGGPAAAAPGAAGGPSTSASSSSAGAVAGTGSVAPGLPGRPSGLLAMGGSHKDYTKSTYWVKPDDAARVKHVLMQHLVLLPAPTNASAAPPSSSAAGAAALWAELDTESRDLVNTIFLDNPSLELYHTLLYGRPYTTTLQLRWYGSRIPDTVQVLRQVHVEGWRPEECTEDSFPIQETRVADFLNGRWTWADARKLLMPGDGERAAAQQRRLAKEDRRASRHQAALGQSPQSMIVRGAYGGASSGGGGGAGGGGSGGVAGLTSSASAPPEDPERLAQEYQLFKTFTEVARLVESKGLQPMVQVRFRQTGWREAGNEGGLTMVMEEEAQMLLEYAYDTGVRLSHGLWRQEHPADAIEFPYATLKIHYPSTYEEELPPWMGELLDSGLLRPMDDFSKFLHACAGLLPDLVRAVPQWVDDEAVQKSLYANVAANEDLQALLRAGHNVVAELEEGVLDQAAHEQRQAAAGAGGRAGSKAAGARSGAAAGGAGEGGSGSAGAPTSRSLSMPAGVGSGSGSGSGTGGGGSRGWFSLLFGRSGSSARADPADFDAHQPLLTSGKPNGSTGPAGSGPGPSRPGRTPTASSGTGGGAGPLGSAERSSGAGAAPGGEAGPGAGPGGPKAPEEGDGESPVIPLLHNLQRNVSGRLGGAAEAAGGAGGRGWQAKLLQRQALQGRAYQPQLMFVDPTQFLRNERIFLMWLRTAITVGGIATAMLGFAASARTDPHERPTIHISETTAFVLLLVAIAMGGYGLGAFVWRSTRFYELHPGRFDDTTGALAMTALVTLALFGLMVANMADLMEVLGGDTGGGGDGGGGGGPPPAVGGWGAGGQGGEGEGAEVGVERAARALAGWLGRPGGGGL